MTVRTRFAPSPTGYLHIGGVRTALFNWLFARKHGGQFILRIDDTDAGRNIESALAPILHGFKWLGIDWDEGAEVGGPYAPYYQSQRLERYQAAVKALLDKGLAYHDYATPEELKAEREAAEKEKRPYHYSRRWLAETAADRARFEAEGRKASVRLKMPREGACEFNDLIRGPMKVAWTQEQDHVVQRADGSCLYNLATVVDDFDMKITHVIRAEEHLSNTPRQIFIAQGLGYPLPEYAHLPFVAEPGSKRKLSKRELEKYLKNADFKKVNEHGRAIAEKLGLEMKPETFNPVIVDFYEQVGYLPQAVVNYLLLLGWAYDDKKEWFTRQEMIDLFGLEKVNKAAASFDVKKLFAFQEHYMQELPLEEKAHRAMPYLIKANVVSNPPTQSVVKKATTLIRAANERIKVFGDILDFSFLLEADDRFEFSQAAVEKHLKKPGSAYLLMQYKERLSEMDVWRQKYLPKAIYDVVSKISRINREAHDAESVRRNIEKAASATSDVANAAEYEGSVRELATDLHLKISDVVHPLRVALTGKTVGIGLFETMEFLGRRACLRRLDRAILLCPTVELPAHLANLPEAIQPADKIRLDLKSINVLRGDFQFEANGVTLQGHGGIILKLQPDQILKCGLTIDYHEAIRNSTIDLVHCGTGARAQAVITGMNFGTDSPAKITAIINSSLVMGGGMVWNVKFHLCNFHLYRGNFVRQNYFAWAARATLSDGDWRITIDSVREARKQQTKAQQTGGVAITHVGSIVQNGNKPFDTKQLTDLVNGLQHCFSFIRGMWVSPILLFGYDNHGDLTWQDWTMLRRMSSWMTVGSWFPILELHAIESVFPGFMRMWNDPMTRGWLQTSLYWYLESNSGTAMDASLVAAVIGLEAVIQLVAERGGGAPELRTGSEGLLELLKRLAIEPRIPLSFADLREFAKDNCEDSGPTVIRLLRNLVTHPTKEGREILVKTEKHPRMWFEVRQLAVWYLELGLLYAMGYDGSYLSRAGGEITPWAATRVPWSVQPAEAVSASS